MFSFCIHYSGFKSSFVWGNCNVRINQSIYLSWHYEKTNICVIFSLCIEKYWLTINNTETAPTTQKHHQQHRNTTNNMKTPPTTHQQTKTPRTTMVVHSSSPHHPLNSTLPLLALLYLYLSEASSILLLYAFMGERM